MHLDDDRVWTSHRADSNAIPRRARDGAKLCRVTRGYYVHVDDADDLDSRLATLLVAVPAGTLSHWTAAQVWGVPLPYPRPVGVHLTVPTGTSRPQRAGVVAHHAREVTRSRVRGLRVTRPARTWLDLAAVGASVTDLVVAADSFGQLGLASAAALEEALQPGHLRGLRRLRQSLELMNPHAESRPETLVRLMLISAGLPMPEVNMVIRCPLTGRFVARVDLCWPQAMLVVEYDGDHHRDKKQWDHDLRRRERLEELGWAVIVLTAADLRAGAGPVVRRVTARYRAGVA